MNKIELIIKLGNYLSEMLHKYPLYERRAEGILLIKETEKYPNVRKERSK